nr:hypothetical protein [Candidatus Sigynarchaeota archaeon]
MITTNDFEALKVFLDQLHGTLFTEHFTTIAEDVLVAQISSMIKLLNKALAYYHDAHDARDQERMSPVLCYSQTLVALLVRLARFDQKDLTRHNQIVADMEGMLLNKAALISTRFREQAEYQRSISKDEKLKDMVEKFLTSCSRE